MRFRILLGLLHAPNPYGAYRTPIDYQKRSGIIKLSPNRCFLFLFPFKQQSQVNNLRSSVSVRRAFSAFRILTARKLDEARANILTKMCMCGDDIVALVQVCTWPECGLIIKPMPSARIAMNAACAATGSSASSFV